MRALVGGKFQTAGMLDSTDRPVFEFARDEMPGQALRATTRAKTAIKSVHATIPTIRPTSSTGTASPVCGHQVQQNPDRCVWFHVRTGRTQDITRLHRQRRDPAIYEQLFYLAKPRFGADG